MSSYALQIQAALIAAYNQAPLGGIPQATDVRQLADLESGLPTTTIVMGPERVLPEERDTPVRKRRRQFDVVHRARPTDVLSAAAIVDPLRIHTVARLVGNELGGLAIDIEEVGEQPRYPDPEKTSVVMFIQALDVIYTTARNDLTQSA